MRCKSFYFLLILIVNAIAYYQWNSSQESFEYVMDCAIQTSRVNWQKSFQFHADGTHEKSYASNDYISKNSNRLKFLHWIVDWLWLLFHRIVILSQLYPTHFSVALILLWIKMNISIFISVTQITFPKFACVRHMAWFY